MLSSDDLRVTTLGDCGIASPLAERGDVLVDEQGAVLATSDAAALEALRQSGARPPAFEPAGPRGRIFFDPVSLSAGIVTCGGLCPGLNDVIRSIVMTLTYGYGVRRVLGFRYGYAGLAAGTPHEPLALTPERVEHIHQQGGTLLGSSRGPQDPGEMVDTLVRLGVGVLFAVGGDGTLRGASRLAREIEARRLAIAIVGIPKTIDNDLLWVSRSFGFTTAVEHAVPAVSAAHTEARGAWNGVGLVKLMGRHSGFIAAHATLPSGDVNFCLVPEVPFRLDGPGGFLAALERRLDARHHAVVVVAEGAGQDLLEVSPERDASGNVRLGDIGPFLRDVIRRHFATRGKPVDVKYIDPSYTIRSLPANVMDSEFCLTLGQHAVHAGLAGRTDVVVGFWNQHFTLVPIAPAVSARRQIDPRGELWRAVLQATGQSAQFASPAT
jgi:6-phosphofructokinase 1